MKPTAFPVTVNGISEALRRERRDRYTFGDREHVALRMVPCIMQALREQSDKHFADADEEPDLRHDLLRALHPTGYRDLRAFATGLSPVTLSVHTGDLAGVDEFAEHYRDRNVFVGVAPRVDDKGRDGAACISLYALFADIDFKDSSEAEARARLAAFPLRPSIIVASGGGLQPYWLLTEPLDIAQAKPLLQALTSALGADPKAAEPARILRLPDSRNYKYDPPRRVVVETFDDSHRYALADLRAVLPAINIASTPTPLPVGVTEGSRNDTLFTEGCRLRRLGWSETEIVVSLRALNAERCHPPLADAEVDPIAQSCARYEPAADTFPATETGDAEAFAARHCALVRFDHLAKRWLLFRNHHWAEQSTGDVHRLALDCIRDRQRAAVGDKGRLRWALDGEKRARQVNLLALAENIIPLADDGKRWDVDADRLGVQNGVINLRTGLLRLGHPDDRITLISPLNYDSRASTTKWVEFVLDVCDGDRPLANYFQVVFGYALTGETGEQCFWIFYGLGSNGKSTLLEILTKYVIPRHSWTMKFPSTKWSESMSDYQRAQLVGRRLIVSKENERTQRLNTEFIKSLTGNEEIEARHPYGRPFNYSPVAKFVMAVNHKPIILDETHAMWRRVRMVPFLRTFPLNPAFAESLIAEAPGVLTWAVEGAVRYYTEGITTPGSVLNATAEYRKESDSLAPFFESRCVLNPEVKVRAQHLFDALRDFYDKRQTPSEERLSQKEFGQRIANDDRFRVAKGEGAQRKAVFYHGVGLVDAVREEVFEL